MLKIVFSRQLDLNLHLANEAHHVRVHFFCFFSSIKAASLFRLNRFSGYYAIKRMRESSVLVFEYIKFGIVFQLSVRFPPHARADSVGIVELGLLS